MRILLKLSGVALAALSLAAQAALPPAVESALAQLRLPESALALYVQPVDAPAPAWQHHEEVPMNPASTMKLVTTWTALEVLGPAYTWRTRLASDGRQEGDVWHGDIWLVGGGDPKLTVEQTWLLLRPLRQRGIRVIDGELRLDRSWFPPQPADDGRFDESGDRPYNVSPDPIAVNFKTVRVHMFGGDAVRVSLEPALPRVTLVNQLRTRPGGCDGWRDEVRINMQSRGGETRIELSGRFPTGCPQASWLTALGSHGEFAAATLSGLWQEMGGEWPKLAHQLELGEPATHAAPPEANTLTAVESAPLTEVIRDVNKFSNNLMARTVFLTLGAQNTRGGDVLTDATQTVKEFLVSRGVNAPELVLENGAGLSRVERISVQHMGQLLLAAWRSRYMPEFLSSLPLAGVDGTLRRRFGADSDLIAAAHLKTGTLKDVRALAGFVKAASGRWVALVAIVNHPAADRAAPVLDAAVQAAYQQF